MRAQLVCLVLLGLHSSLYAVVDKPKHVFVISSHCDERLGSSVLAGFREAIRASRGYQLATSLADDGGYDVVIVISFVCTESALPTSEKVVAVAAIIGTGTCTLGSCSISPDVTTLQAELCSGSKGVDCGKDLYSFFDQYSSGDGDRMFQQLSQARKKMSVQ